MVVSARADIVKAVNNRLRSFSELTALVGTSPPRISAELQDAWAMPTRAILLRKAGGPPGDLLGRKVTRLDTFCYGGSGLEAHNVWAMLDAILCPVQGQGVMQFRRDGCRIDEIVAEADAQAGTEQDSGWPRVFTPYLVYWWTL